MTTALSRIADPLDFQKEWPAVPRVWKGHDVGGLFQPADAEAILSDPTLTALQVAMVRGGVLSGEQPHWPHPTDTLGLNGLHLTWPALRDFCRQLTYELGHPVTANVYLTPPHEQGFGAHWDTHHVWLCQIEGAKLWHLSEPVFAEPLNHQTWTRIGFTPEQLDRVKHSPDMTVLLEKGDVLWIPRGWVHWGTTDEQPSGHITLGVHLLTWSWVLQHLLSEGVGGHVALREALPPGLEAPVLPAMVEEAMARMVGMFADVRVEEMAASLRRAQHTKFTPAE